MLYNVVLVSAIQLGESVTNYIYIYLLPPEPPSLPHTPSL